MGRNAIGWDPITPAEAAAHLGLDYQPRAFSDLADAPCRTAVETLACHGLVSGDGTGRFLPERVMTRGELAAMLASAFQFPVPENATPFSDVDPDAWYAPAVAAVTARDFLTGTGEGKFQPERPLTNQELYPVLAALAEWASLDAARAAEEPFTAYQWLDYYRYPEWAQEGVRNLESLGVSVDRENPGAPVTRGACAQALYETMDAIGMFWY